MVEPEYAVATNVPPDVEVYPVVVAPPARHYVHERGDDVIDVTVQTASGADMGKFQTDCGGFSTSIDLPAGSYVASAVLVDASGNDRTTPVDLNPFRIRGDDVRTTPIDFPAGSFL